MYLAVVKSHHVHLVCLLTHIINNTKNLYMSSWLFFPHSTNQNLYWGYYFYNLHPDECPDICKSISKMKQTRPLFTVLNSFIFSFSSFDEIERDWNEGELARFLFLSEHLRKQRTTVYLCFPFPAAECIYIRMHSSANTMSSACRRSLHFYIGFLR